MADLISPDDALEALAPIARIFEEQGYTNQQALDNAQIFIDEYLQRDSGRMDELLGQKEDQTEQIKGALTSAREKIAEQKFSKGRMFAAMAAGFGGKTDHVSP